MTLIHYAKATLRIWRWKVNLSQRIYCFLHFFSGGIESHVFINCRV